MDLALIAAVSALFSFGVVFIIINIRESVKLQRQEIIKDIDAIFATTSENNNTVVPSLEFLKYKYLFERRDADNSTEIPKDYRTIHWIMSAVPLIATLFALNAFSIMTIRCAMSSSSCSSWLNGYVYEPAIPWVIVASYAGGLIAVLHSLFRAINNFDLSPFSFVGAWINICTGCVAAVILVFGLVHPAANVVPDSVVDEKASFALILVAAFAIGYLPDVATRQIIRTSELRHYKKESIGIYKSFTALPVEIIDGIDSEIRSRLYDFNIVAVQNLAAANPLMLYVETPYGVYQIMDWVAQAQLCCSVGPEALLKLWKIGIRTIFDLERAVTDDLCRNDQILLAIGRIIITDQDKSAYTIPAVTANINMRLEDPHVLRLRQIVRRVGDLFGAEARRLRPVR